MIHDNAAVERREIYIMAFSESQINKWDNSLRLQKQPIYVDPALEKLTQNLLKKMDPRVEDSNQTLKNI